MNLLLLNKHTGAAVSVSMSVILGGCMVGPDYKAPTAPVAEAYQDPGSDTIKRSSADLVFVNLPSNLACLATLYGVLDLIPQHTH